MKFKQSPQSGNLVVELEPGNTQLLGCLNGPITALKKLLVPIDFSACSRHALRYAIALAKQFDAEVTLLTVIQNDHTSFEYGNPEYVALQEQRETRCQKELAKLGDEQFGRIRHHVLVKTGKPFKEIVLTAKELDLDLIVISTHGYPGVARTELGSTAERVIRHATCPVLMVRPVEREFVPPV